MTDTWKLRGGTPEEGKSADELALANLTNLGKRKAGKDECCNCGKKGHKSYECTAEKKGGDGSKGGGGKKGGGGGKKHCNYCDRDGHVEANCFRKPMNACYMEFPPKPAGKNETSLVEIILADVERSFVETEKVVDTTELCLADMERYANDIEYESHEERCAHDVEYESSEKSVEESGIEFVYLPTSMGCLRAPGDGGIMHVQDTIREPRVQVLNEDEVSLL